MVLTSAQQWSLIGLGALIVLVLIAYIVYLYLAGTGKIQGNPKVVNLFGTSLPAVFVPKDANGGASGGSSLPPANVGVVNGVPVASTSSTSVPASNAGAIVIKPVDVIAAPSTPSVATPPVVVPVSGKTPIKFIKFVHPDPGILELVEVMAYDLNGKLLGPASFSEIQMSSCRDCVGDVSKPHTPALTAARTNTNDPWFLLDGITAINEDDNFGPRVHTGNYGVNPDGSPKPENKNHFVNMVLVSPTALSKVVVYTMLHYGGARNLGTSLMLLDANGGVVLNKPLTVESTQTFSY